MPPTMGRRRQTNTTLPPRMHEKSGTYYYVTSTIPRKWIKLGKDLAAAKKKWAEYECGEQTGVSLSDLIEEWAGSDVFKELSENTQRQYNSVIKQLKAVFAEFSTVSDIKPHHIAAWQDSHKSRVNANTGKSILSTVLRIAVRRGLIDRNPAGEVENLTVQRRKRYLTDEEFIAIRTAAHPVLRAAMDLSYVTGARIGDILAIKLSNITNEGLTIRQEKTDKLQLFKWNDALRKAIDNARTIKHTVRSVYLLCGPKGQRYRYNNINIWWLEARKKAEIEDAHFHDIRGKSATDAKRAGIDYQALLGHTTKAMSDSYIKLEDAQHVEPMQKML